MCTHRPSDRPWSEVTHWTGPSLERAKHAGNRFGSDAYAAEELVALLGAAMHGPDLGIPSVARENHAPYLAGWLMVLNANLGHLWSVAAAAEQAITYVKTLAERAITAPAGAELT